MTGDRMTGRVGVFDSGVGGLSVWRELRNALPHLSTIYVADQAHIPYGPLPPATVLEYSLGIVCNSASAAALQPMRTQKPHLDLVGMEPAIKPAAESSRSGVVVVLATANTLEGELFQNTSQRHAAHVRVIAQPCPGLVEQIERGETDTQATRDLLRILLEQPLLAGADTCVLGCTHYAFVRPLLQSLLPDQSQIIDPAAAIARRVQRLFEERATANPARGVSPTLRHEGQHQLWTTGPVDRFVSTASKLLHEDIQARALCWTPRGLQPPA